MFLQSLRDSGGETKKHDMGCVASRVVTEGVHILLSWLADNAVCDWTREDIEIIALLKHAVDAVLAVVERQCYPMVVLTNTRQAMRQIDFSLASIAKKLHKPFTVDARWTTTRANRINYQKQHQSHTRKNEYVRNRIASALIGQLLLLGNLIIHTN